MNALTLPVSFGEAADKITILQIKQERIRDSGKLTHIRSELSQVSERFFAAATPSAELEALLGKLKAVNEQLWELEDAIRKHDREGDFGAEFIRLARAIYVTNDQRARVKREVDLLLGSSIVEEKSYVEHAGSKP